MDSSRQKEGPTGQRETTLNTLNTDKSGTRRRVLGYSDRILGRAGTYSTYSVTRPLLGPLLGVGPRDMIKFQ
ncbi:MAG: hypothetical protein ACMUJM_13930 [bacterium]